MSKILWYTQTNTHILSLLYKDEIRSYEDNYVFKIDLQQLDSSNILDSIQFELCSNSIENFNQFKYV